MITETNKRIAKNTMMLYIRMLLTISVSLYTSRVVLSVLGVDDYGVYNVVGGVVVMFSFLNSSLSGASARFITFELGRGDAKQLKLIFGGSMTVHIMLSLIVFVLAETIGLWFLETKLVIPESRMFAARIVYQLSILSCLVSITQVPYSAAIIAHEQMQVYAYVSILEVTLKLIMVFLLFFCDVDKLVLYALLIFIVSLVVASVYRWYCRCKFSECRLTLVLDKKVLMPMLSYSGWDLYGNMSVVAKDQGINILLNTFFGVVVNAASGIAIQVQGVLSSFVNNFLMAVRPQIVKSYATNDLDNMVRLIINSSKFSFVLMFLLSFPLLLENEFILKLWLKNVPEYAVDFCRLYLVINIFSVIFTPILFSIHATGRIKMMSFTSGTIFMLSLPLSYVLLKNGCSPVIPYAVTVVLHFCACLSYLWVLTKKLAVFSAVVFVKKVVLVCCWVAILSSLLPLFVYTSITIGWLRFLLVGSTSVISVLFVSYYVALDKSMRIAVVNRIKVALKLNR